MHTNIKSFFCGDSKTSCQQELECSCLVSEAFGRGRVYLSSPSPFLPSEPQRITQATTLLARNILELHELSKIMEYPQHFLIFTYGEGMKVVELVLKELSPHNINIHVYSFGGTTTLISNQLATKVHHYIFQDHLNPQCSILSRMHSILLKMQSQQTSHEVAVMQEASEQNLKIPLSRIGDDFFDPELINLIEKYERYFENYSVTFLDESSLEPSHDKESCEFLAYAQVIREIAQTECNPEN